MKLADLICMNRSAFASGFAAALGALACSDTGQDRVEIPLYVAGTEVSGPVETVSGDEVTILRADLAFGPLYLCSGNTAGDICDTARIEWLDTAVVDTMSEDVVAAGTLSGVSGPVRSWMYDLGISSQLTRSEPHVLEAAEELGDASFVLEALVSLNGLEIPLSASLPIRQTETTELGVPVIRKGTDSRFSHEVTGNEASLSVRFDAAEWVSRLDLAGLVEDAACAAGGPPIVCQGQVEQTCDGEGNAESTRDCTELDQVCLAGHGCAEAVILHPETTAYRSLAVALTTAGRPEFVWED